VFEDIYPSTLTSSNYSQTKASVFFFAKPFFGLTNSRQGKQNLRKIKVSEKVVLYLTQEKQSKPSFVNAFVVLFRESSFFSYIYLRCLKLNYKA